jgi:mannose-6-phosphate isomerase-like protein (cupin superfamily)
MGAALFLLVIAGATPALAAAPVTYVPAAEVKAAFDKGAVLFDGAGGRNYRVHASRRDTPGQGEVHVRDTDIIYVLDGSATFVTGGTLVDGRTTAPDELRGPEIEGGETRRIGKGDVLIVPAGTPHWFKEVAGPVLYYVVKVR